MAWWIAECPAPTGYAMGVLWYGGRNTVFGDDGEPSIPISDDGVGATALATFSGVARDRGLDEVHCDRKPYLRRVAQSFKATVRTPSPTRVSRKEQDSRLSRPRVGGEKWNGMTLGAIGSIADREQSP